MRKNNPISREELEELCKAMNLHRPGVLFYFDFIETLSHFNDAEVGQMVIALMRYAKTGEREEFDDRAMQVAMINQYPRVDADGESWAMNTLQSRYASDCKKYRDNPKDKPTLEEWVKQKQAEYNLIRALPRASDYQLKSTDNRPEPTDDRSVPIDDRSEPTDIQNTNSNSAPATTQVTITTPNTEQRDRETEFERLWEEYPKKVGKEAAREVYRTVDEPLTNLLEAIQQQRQSAQWQQDGGRFIPELANWLHGKRWHDVLPRAEAGYIRHDDPISPGMLAAVREMLNEPDD